MSQRLRIVTDSASMIPPQLRHRFDVIVASVTITLDGVEYHEHDLDTAHFYRRLGQGATVSTAAPSPGSLLAAYRQAHSDGADAILSIHTGAAYSATVSSATLAARQAAVPVTVVDTSLGSFPVALCIWAAADVISAGGSVDDAVAAANEMSTHTASVFVIGAPDLARRGGRFAAMPDDIVATSIIELDSAGVRELCKVADIDSALAAMADHTRRLAAERPLRVGVGHAARLGLGQALIESLAGAEGIAEIVPYEIGPSVGAHSGAGTVGVVWGPA